MTATIQYDQRFRNLQASVSRNNRRAALNNPECKCYFTDPVRHQVGADSDGNPVYVQVKTCQNCGSEEIW